MQPLLSSTSGPGRLSHQPTRLPPLLLFRGNPMSQLIEFTPSRPADLSLSLSADNGANATILTPAPELVLVGANAVLVRIMDTGTLPSLAFLTLSWGGKVQLGGEIRTGRGLQNSPANLPALQVNVGASAVLSVQTAPPDLWSLLAQSGGGSIAVTGETPVGAVDGQNATFQSLHPFAPESVEVFISGVRLTLLADYNTSGNNTITLFDSPLAGELVRINYTRLL